MSKIKNKDTLYAVLRKDIERKQDVVCAFAKTIEGAERLCDEYTQAFVDSGGNLDESYYYPVANTFYDE
jgi:hypothetical protein